MVDISLKKTFQQQEYGLSNLSNGIGNNIEVDLRHAYDASEADFFRPKFSFHVSSPDRVIQVKLINLVLPSGTTPST